jgi:hypothetical protein
MDRKAISIQRSINPNDADLQKIELIRKIPLLSSINY